MAFKEADLLKLKHELADFGAIHRSILSGLLNCIAQKKDKSFYRGSGGKDVYIFPGSALAKKAGNWILAAEQIETSKLFARKVSNIDVEWLERLGGKLCKKTYSEPIFNEENGIVEVSEKVTLYGLTIVPRRNVPYARINHAEATRHFIQEGLVSGRLRSRLPFFIHNGKLKQQLLDQDAKLRRNREYDLDAAQEAFYTERIQRVGSVHELNRLIKNKKKENQGGFLKMKFEDFFELVDEENGSVEDFPEYWESGQVKYPLSYEFQPGSPSDGVTLKVHDQNFLFFHPHALEWLVPVFWEERIFHLLKSLPKITRRHFVPLADSAKGLRTDFNLPQEILSQLAENFQMGHFLCMVFHWDFVLKKGVDPVQVKHQILQILDKNKAKYPAEHNVGHLYKADPALEKFYRRLDPINSFNSGIGKTSKKKHYY